MKESRFKTSYDIASDTSYALTTTDTSLVLPDLTFSIQELSKRFSVNQLLLLNSSAKALFDVKDTDSISDDDFDRPSVNLPKNYDLVDSYNQTKKFFEIRKRFRDDMKNIEKRKAEEAYKKQVADEIKASETKTE